MVKHNKKLLEYIRLYNKGVEVKDISLRTGDYYQYIYRLLKNCGVYKPKHDLYAARTVKYIKLYKRAWYISDIGRKFRKDRTTIIHHLKRANVFRPGNSGKLTASGNIPKIQVQESTNETSAFPPPKNFIYKEIVEKQRIIEKQKYCTKHVPSIGKCFKCGYSEPV